MIIITRKDWPALQREAFSRANHTSGLLYKGCKPIRTDSSRLSCLQTWTTDYPIIPREEWPRLIKEGQGSFLKDYNQGLLPSHNQGSTSRCWVHGSVRAMEYLGLWEGKAPQLLSPDSVAYPIEGTRDRGGYPEDACQQIAKFGACRQELWPERDLSPKRADPNWKADALYQRLLRWIVPETFEQQFTLAIYRIPGAIGLGWWGHLVCALQPVQIGTREFGLGIDNSWGDDWKDHGYAVLDEESATADLGSFYPISETWKPCQM